MTRDDTGQDPVFAAEQRHLGDTYAQLLALEEGLVREIARIDADAEGDKKAMSDEFAGNYATDDDAMESWADMEALNSIIDAYNMQQDRNARELSNVRLLLQQPYFAKIALRFKVGAAPKEIYLGTAGISGRDYRRIVVDWRSPVAEAYYNQGSGPVSYKANGRTMHAELLQRRQFDIVRDRLNAYFDSSIAIQDPLLLKSLSKRRSDRMQAITATIQREQNVVIRHEDVPALLVSGVAGSGKTSVLMQRIAYLFYRMRDRLDAREVFLITPNSVFSRFVEDVLPGLGERNPVTLTWDEFAMSMLPEKRPFGRTNATPETLFRIEDVAVQLEFEAQDYQNVESRGAVLLTAAQVRQAAAKHRDVPAGPRLVELVAEDLTERLGNRIRSMAASEASQDEVCSLPPDEQVRLFGQTIDELDEEQVRSCTLSYLQQIHARAYDDVRCGGWLKIDRIGMRMLGTKSLDVCEWLYLKIACTGIGVPEAKYVMVDEVQDYTAAQLVVLARYFRHAHFVMLGDEYQALEEGTPTFDKVLGLFSRLRGKTDRCNLNTSYRSTPQITRLFSSLLPADEQLRISSVQRDDEPPVIIECLSPRDYEESLHRAIDGMRQLEGLSVVIAADPKHEKRLTKLLGDDAPVHVGPEGKLPHKGVVLMSLKSARGLEFDQVIVPDASESRFPEDKVSRNRLYTAISRATRRVTIISNGPLTPLLKR